MNDQLARTRCLEETCTIEQMKLRLKDVGDHGTQHLVRYSDQPAGVVIALRILRAQAGTSMFETCAEQGQPHQRSWSVKDVGGSLHECDVTKTNHEIVAVAPTTTPCRSTRSGAETSPAALTDDDIVMLLDGAVSEHELARGRRCRSNANSP